MCCEVPQLLLLQSTKAQFLPTSGPGAGDPPRRGGAERHERLVAPAPRRLRPHRPLPRLRHQHAGFAAFPCPRAYLRGCWLLSQLQCRKQSSKLLLALRLTYSDCFWSDATGRRGAGAGLCAALHRRHHAASSGRSDMISCAVQASICRQMRCLFRRHVKI